MFPLKNEIPLEKGSRPAQEVVERLKDLLTPQRLAKIEQVLRGRTFTVSVVLENIYDRGNASAVMRSAEALGLAGIHSIEPGEKFKESQRTTAGADKWVELRRWKSTSACIEHLRSEGRQIIVTALSANSRPIGEIDFTRPTSLVLGNEKDGASAEMIQNADACVILPMVGFTQSYNISVAGALCFYHIYQDRMRRLGFHGDLSEAERMILRAHYYLRTQASGYDILNKV